MKLYAVSREGVYRHQIMGVYSELEVAVDRAVNVCKAEVDDYHHFDVLEFDMNQDVTDGKLFAKISRKKDSISIHRIKYDE